MSQRTTGPVENPTPSFNKTIKVHFTEVDVCTRFIAFASRTYKIGKVCCDGKGCSILNVNEPHLKQKMAEFYTLERP